MFTKRKGFTLIELLVVIAIIAILAAILFPVFAKVREKARQTSCLSNMKQIGLAVLQYNQDFDETYPMVYASYSSDGGVTGHTGADAALNPYIKSGAIGTSRNGDVYGGVWHCPSYPDIDHTSEYHFRQDLFGASWYIPNNWTGRTGTVGNLMMVGAPANKIMMIEAGRYGAGNSNSLQFYTDQWAGWSDAGSASASADGSDAGVPAWSYHDCDEPNGTNNGWNSCELFPRYRHSGMSNFLFLDGHAKAKTRGSLNWYRDIYIGRMDEDVSGVPYWGAPDS